jgi:hypothetical protein
MAPAGLSRSLPQFKAGSLLLWTADMSEVAHKVWALHNQCRFPETRVCLDRLVTGVVLYAIDGLSLSLAAQPVLDEGEARGRFGQRGA